MSDVLINMRFLKDHYKTFLWLFLPAIVIYHAWFSFNVFANSDWEFHFSETLKDFTTPSIWVGNQAMGFENLIIWRAPFFFFYGLFGYLDVFSNVAEKFMVFFPIIFLLPLASFLLIRNVVGSTTASVIGSFVFTYSSYFLSIDTQGHQFLTLAAGVAVLALYFLVVALKRTNISFAILSGISLAIAGICDFRMAYIFFALFFSYTAFFVYGKRKYLWPRIYLFMLLSLVFILLNIFWVLPFYNMNVLTEGGALARDLFGGNFFNLDKALYLSHPFWNGRGVKWFLIQETPVWLYLLSILAFVGFWLGRKNKEVLFFGCVALIGIFLSKQTNDPFDALYLFFYNHVLGFSAFREASKFYVLIALGYGVMIGALCKWILESSWNFKYWIVSGVAVLSLWNGMALVTGSIDTMFVPRHIADDYLRFNAFTQEQGNFFRILGVPGPSRWNQYTFNHPQIGMVGIVQSVWQPLAQTDVSSLPTKNRITNIFEKPFANNLLDISSAKYVIVPLQDTENDDDFFKYYGEREFFVEELDKLSYLKKIDIGTEELVVYENENYRPHIYTTKEKETIQKEVSFEKVYFHSQNPTEYSVNLKNVSEPVYINFSEKYHPDWKIRAGEFYWLDVLTKKDYFLPDTLHSENDAKLNSFLIDPAYIKKNFSKDAYTLNPDGSINLDLTLYFKPQSYFYLGLIISGTTLVLCLGHLGYSFVKNRKRKGSQVS